MNGVVELGRGVTIWGIYSHAVMTLFEAAADDLMAVDLVASAAGSLLPGWAASSLPLPSLTIGDIVDFAAGQGDPAIRDALVDRLEKLSDIAWFIPGTGNLDDRLTAARDVVDLLLSPTPFTYPPDVLPTGPLQGFPDVYEAFFGGGRRALLLDSVRRLGSGTEVGVLGTLRAAQGLALGAAELAAAEGQRQARLGAGLHLPERERAQRAVVGSLFAPLRGEIEARAAAGTTPDPLSQAFDAAVAGGGITAAAAAVPAFLGRLRDHWQVRTEATAHPTSAHILARRGRFAGVRVPRLTVRAGGHPATEGLADVVAARFRTAATGAYRDGFARMVSLQADATAPPQPRQATRTGGGRRGR
jgi:hypothetical protein